MAKLSYHRTVCTTIFIISILNDCGLCDKVLTSPMVTNWGMWGDFERCSPGTYVTAFRLRTERWNYGGGVWDDTCLNSIRFYCGGIGEETNKYITSSEGSWGEWGSKMVCNGHGFAIGFMLRSEEANTPLVDETAANNLRILCSGSTEGFMEGDGESWGEWTAPRLCQSHQYICGLQTQVQEYQGITRDDTALNNMRIECCDLPSNVMERFNLTKHV